MHDLKLFARQTLEAQLKRNKDLLKTLQFEINLIQLRLNELATEAVPKYFQQANETDIFYCKVLNVDILQQQLHVRNIRFILEHGNARICSYEGSERINHDLPREPLTEGEFNYYADMLDNMPKVPQLEKPPEKLKQYPIVKKRGRPAKCPPNIQ